MPLYEFKCKKCGTEYEEKQSLEDVNNNVPPPACPECSSADVDRLISKLRATSTSWSIWRR